MRDPDGAVEDQGLDDEWVAQIPWRTDGPSTRKYGKARNPNTLVAQDLLRDRFVPGEEQPARVAARVGDAEELQVRGSMLIVHRDTVKILEKIEQHLGSEPLDRP